MKQKDDSTEYTVEYSKYNRIFSGFEFINSDISEIKNKGDSEKILFINQTLRDTIYNSLIKKIPGFEELDSKYMNLQKGVIRTDFSIKPASTELIIYSAIKNQIYDEDEIIVHK
ncbi:MAG: hypothetical protein H7Y18_14430 [Clostridiaceae bacterium]|nr:hypothetical protein [Clostridiaceae bacterium]